MWMQGKPEVEIVDMVLKIKNKIKKCEVRDIPVKVEVKARLNERLQDIMSSLPDDLKTILHVA